MTGRTGRWRRAIRAIGSIGCVVALGQAATAQTVTPPNPYVCNELAARLARLPRAAPTPVDQWTTAISEQRAAMVQNQATLARCGAAEDPRCAPIAARYQQMVANLAQLERQRARMGGAQASGSPERARIEATMAQMNCGAMPATGRNAQVPPPARSTARVGAADEAPPGVGGTSAAPAQPQQRGFFSMLFGGSGPSSGVHIFGSDEPGQETAIDPEQEKLAAQMSGSYRTLCVRTCDGYFFPISFNAPRGRFKTDANVCSALCPGTETRLYYHNNPGAEAEQAIAADDGGEPLTKLPNAFLYRTRVVPGCACGRPDPRLLPVQAGGLQGGRAPARDLDPAALPMPRPRPAPDEDPETQANVVAGFTPVPVEAQIVPPVIAAEPEKVATSAGEAPKVRTVGPKFFSDR